MRVLRVMLVLVPMLAFAGWRQIATTPSIADIQLVDAGVVLTTSSVSGAIAWSVSDAGVTQLNTLVGAFVGSGYFGANCLVGISAARAVSFSPGCGLPTSILSSATVLRFRLMADPPMGIAVLNSGSFDSMFSGPNPDGGWDPQGLQWNSGGTRSIQGARVGGVIYTVITDGLGVGGLSLKLSVDAGPPTDILGLGVLRDATPFDRAGAPALIGVVSAGGSLVLVPDLRNPTASLPASRDAGVTARYVAMGKLAGMATTAGGAVIGPVPNPARPAETWMIRGSPPVAVTDKISCIDDRRCVTFDTLTGNIWFFENEFAPGVAVSVPTIDAGQTIRLIADAGDADGDPIFVSWSGGGGGTFVRVPGVDDGTMVDFTAPVGACAPATINVTVSDGLPAHDRTIQVPLPILDRGRVQLTAGVSTALAGGPPAVFRAFIDGGCSTANLSWSSSDLQSGAGDQFAWTPPPLECSADGGQVTITTTATWSTGAPASTSSSQVVVVQPWGVPNAPLFASPGAQQSGTTFDWLSSGVEHGCSASNRFPGTELIWSEVDAGTTTTQFIDGGLRITAPLSCIAQQVTATARRQVIGEDGGRISPPATLVVDLVPDTAPLTAATGFSISVGGDAGVLFGVVNTDAGCLNERGATAQLTVFNAGRFVVDGGFQAQGGWALPAPGGCAGGTYEVIGALFENGTFTGATDRGSVTLLYTPAKVGTLSAERVEVTCGAGASAQLNLMPAPNACGAAALSWRVVSGPPLATMSGSGAALTLQTESLDYSAVGQQVVLLWAADAGAGNTDVATRTVELGVRPFLEVAVKVRPPLRREEEAVALEITLTNATDCAVEGLVLTLPLSGASPILESALIGEVHAAARLTDEGVVVEGVAVPAQGKTTVSLSARARLLSSPAIAPVAFLRGYQVSTALPIAAPATGCGCSELASPFFMLVLLVLRRRPLAARAGRGRPVASFA